MGSEQKLKVTDNHGIDITLNAAQDVENQGTRGAAYFVGKEGNREVHISGDGRLIYSVETAVAGVRRNQFVTNLERWRDKGVITGSEYGAGERFRQNYLVAQTPVQYAVGGMERIDKSRKQGQEEMAFVRAKARAEDELRIAYAAVGLRGSACLAQIVGEEMTVNAFAKISRMTNDVAKGMLLASLSCLATARY